MGLASDTNCQACALAEFRTKIVDGQGSPQPLLMVVAEAPGRYEDEAGFPFVGSSGQKLRSAIAEFGLHARHLYLTNSVRCRPPNNRNPSLEEKEACLPWLVEELRQLQPPVVLTAGLVARGQMAEALTYLEADEQPQVFHALHPAAVMRNPKKQREWELDIQRAVYAALGRELPDTAIAPQGWTYKEVADPADVWTMLQDNDRLALDTETVPNDVGRPDRWVTLQLSTADHSLLWERQRWGESASRTILSEILQWSHAEGNTLVIQNMKYDWPVIMEGLREWNLTDDAFVGAWRGSSDTMLLAYNARLPEVGLKKFGPRLTGISMFEIGTLFGRGKKKQNFAEVMDNPDKRALAIEYACRDTIVTYRSEPALRSMMTERQQWHHDHLDHPLVPVLSRMEQRGVRINVDALRELDHTLEEEMVARKAECVGLLGQDIITQPKLLGPALRDLGLPLVDTTKTGDLSVEKPALLRACQVVHEEQLDDDPDPMLGIVRALLGYRVAAKLRSTYTRGIQRRLDSEGAIHARFNQCGSETGPFTLEAKSAPATGRLSSSEPNLQNIPVKGRIGLALRNLFIPRPGYLMFAADMSQLELRIWASVVEARNLIETFNDTSADFHTALAQSLGINRYDAKVLIYAVLYGADIPKITQLAGKTTAQGGKEFIQRMRDGQPQLLEWPTSIERQLETRGWVETLFGFRNEYPLYFSPVRREQREAVRQACNMPIQGTAADLMKMVMIRFDAEIAPKYDCHQLIQVHDEIVGEIPEDADLAAFGRDVAALGRDCGETVLTAPLAFDPGWGASWGEAKH